MSVSKAQKIATAKFDAQNYDKILLRLRKGKKQKIETAAKAAGQSVNGFINLAIDKSMSDSSDTPPTSVPATVEGVAVKLSDEIIKSAQRGAELAGESVSDFISRSIAEQIKRDKISLNIGVIPTKWKDMEGNEM